MDTNFHFILCASKQPINLDSKGTILCVELECCEIYLSFMDSVISLDIRRIALCPSVNGIKINEILQSAVSPAMMEMHSTAVFLR
jgi:hypothetical protein